MTVAVSGPGRQHASTTSESRESRDVEAQLPPRNEYAELKRLIEAPMGF